MPHMTVDIKTCCSRQSSTDMYVIYIFEYISSSFFHEIFKSNIVFTNVPFSVQTKDAWSLSTYAMCAAGHLLLHPHQSPGQHLCFFDCIKPKSFLCRKILAAYQTKLVSADLLSLARQLRFHGTKPLWLCLGRVFLKAAMKMISSRCLWGERIDWEELVINNMTMKLAKSSFQKQIVQVLWYPLSLSSSNQMILCQKALQRTR